MRLQTKACRIKAVVLDVDGVLTDARTGYGPDEHEIKFFSVRDGLGVDLARQAGLLVGIISGRRSKANARRAEELKLDFAFQGERDKAAAFARLLAERGLTAEECLYIGDDLIDIPVMRRAGLAVAVADAAPELDLCSDFRTLAKGGAGAVRETLEWLLKEQGKWQDLVAKYFAD